MAEGAGPEMTEAAPGTSRPHAPARAVLPATPVPQSGSAGQMPDPALDSENEIQKQDDTIPGWGADERTAT